MDMGWYPWLDVHPRWLEKMIVDPVTGCWAWPGRIATNGYALNPNGTVASRSSWEQANGRRLPPGADVEHTCRRRSCTRPEHLEAVTREENQRRKSARYRLITMTTCQRGHRYGDFGVATPEGGLICAACCGVPNPNLAGKTDGEI